MKPSDTIAATAAAPSLFQIAAFFDDFFPAGGFQRSTGSHRRLPFAEFMANPELLLKVLSGRKSKSGGRAADAPPKDSPQTKRSSRTGRPQKSGAANGNGANGNGVNGHGVNGHGSLPPTPRKVEFALNAPAASLVKLVGDFTDWEQGAIEMMHSADGIWFTVVPLAPGTYCYRFIVDGEWRHDPRSDRRIPNPFGTQNDLLHVA